MLTAPYKGMILDWSYPRNKTLRFAKNRILSKSETIDILQREVARLFGGCKVQEIPMNTGLKEYMGQRTRQFSAARHWNFPVK